MQQKPGQQVTVSQISLGAEKNPSFFSFWHVFALLMSFEKGQRGYRIED